MIARFHDTPRPRSRRGRVPASVLALAGAGWLGATVIEAAAFGAAIAQEPASSPAPSDSESQASASPEAAALRNPVPYTADAIARGRKHYLRLCQTCHGYDGRALENIDYDATDLTKPEKWRFGTSDADLFRTTKDGAGQDMPPFGARLQDREIWELVIYLRSIGPEKLRTAPAQSESETPAPPGPRVPRDDGDRR